jgi:hypothetical protein
MGDACSLQLNVVIELYLYLYMSYEIDVEDDNYLYHRLIDYTCRFSIGCKPIMITT